MKAGWDWILETGRGQKEDTTRKYLREGGLTEGPKVVPVVPDHRSVQQVPVFLDYLGLTNHPVQVHPGLRKVDPNWEWAVRQVLSPLKDFGLALR